ncbi:hypothetical protein Cni_G26225 [Canna indica]|uniref:J domain-containing protein n=1 Tax=Canna indica TaxID=4628 RepID=A0AAQ3KYK5_9LILI|nr:hypothetical protein Cni_G26225 [Canna indica]
MEPETGITLPPEAVAPPPPPAELAEPNPESEAEEDVKPVADTEEDARRLKALAEEKLRSSSLKSALKYAKRAARISPDLDGVSQMITALKVLRADPSDHYKILRLPPFSTPAAVRKQYKTLALTLHPDKASASAHSFPAFEDAFKRIADSFRFLSDRSLKRDFDLRLRLSLSAADTAENEAPIPPATFWTACTTCRLLHEFNRKYVGYRLVCPSCRKSFLAVEVPPCDKTINHENGEKKDEAQVRVTRSRSTSRPRIPRFPALVGDKKRKADMSSSPVSKVLRVPEKTLAEVQMELIKEKGKDKSRNKRKEKEKGKEISFVAVKKEVDDFSLMAVEDSDFYNFDTDRIEKSFRKSQIWAIYDDDDGMPRHYGLIDEVISINPFRMKMKWLDIQNSGDETLMLQQKAELHISCGVFKVGKKVNIDSVNCFSHLVNCERAARELYRIYPKKGSVWALYGEQYAGEHGRHYDIVVCLTSFHDVHGLSTAYLEKVEGYKTIFKRQAIGCHAIKCLKKDDMRLFSHQIPARKISETEGLNLPRDCWELDPASLPPDLLRIGCGLQLLLQEKM